MNKIVLNKEKVVLMISTEGGYAHVVGVKEDAHWELCSEQIARNDYENRKATVEQIIDGGIFFPETNLVMSFSCGADSIIEVENVPSNIVAYEYKYIDGEFVVNTPVRIKNIKTELDELDAVINRATEDLYITTGATAYANVQDVINKKNELRAELAQLEA
jgi:hypothetical protein